MGSIKYFIYQAISVSVISVFITIVLITLRYVFSGGYLEITASFILSLIVGTMCLLMAYLLKHCKILRSSYIDTIVPLFIGIILSGVSFFAFGDKSYIFLIVCIAYVYIIHFGTKSFYKVLLKKRT
jgi:hypothetical protein